MDSKANDGVVHDGFGIFSKPPEVEQENPCAHNHTVAVLEKDGTLLRCEDCGAGRGGLDKPWGPPVFVEDGPSIVQDGDPVQFAPETATKEEARAALFVILNGLMDELEADESFCGVAVECFRMTGTDKIGAIQMVACDNVGGNGMRRIDLPT